MPSSDANAVPSVLTQLSKAYEIVRYDVAFQGVEEKERMKKLGVIPDKGRLTFSEEPVTIRETPDGHHISFLRLPSLQKGEDVPSAELIEQISKMVKKEQEQSDMVVGLCDWGWVGERQYIANAPEYVPDILLGSGYGSGVIGRFDDNRRCSWNRPYDKGRTLIEVRVNTWPDRTKPETWEIPDAIQSLSIGLGDKYLDNPDVNALFQ